MVAHRVCEREWGSENPLERGHAVLKSLNWREVAPVERDRERVSADELVDVSTEEKGELEGNVVVGDFLVRPLLLLFLVVRAAREVGDEGLVGETFGTRTGEGSRRKNARTRKINRGGIWW